MSVIDLTVYPNLSPRIIEIPAPTVNVSVQDLVDSIRAWEDTEAGMLYPLLLDANGKDDLGGGVLVGITVSLKNAQVAFENRVGAETEGSVTTGDSAGVVLTDTGATFISDGVTKGATVYNITDKSAGTVLSIDSETQITLLTALSDGTDNQFDSSDVFKITNKIACEISGGNLVAVDGVGTTIAAFMPTASTYVTRTSSSSATLAEQADIQYASFGGSVHVNVLTGTAGTAFPIGTPRQKVSNITDAISIASTRGFNSIMVHGDITLGASAVLTGFNVMGESPIHSVITIDTAAEVTNTIFSQCTITGILDGNNVIENCHIGNITYFNGSVHDCLINNATITLDGGADAHFINCWSGVIGAGSATIDMGGSGQTVGIRGYAGGIKITNKSGAEEVSIDMESGKVTLDATVTGGTFYIRGIIDLIDNSSGTTLATTGLLNTSTVADAVWDEPMADHTATGSAGKNVLQEDNFLNLK